MSRVDLARNTSRAMLGLWVVSLLISIDGAMLIIVLLTMGWMHLRGLPTPLTLLRPRDNVTLGLHGAAIAVLGLASVLSWIKLPVSIAVAAVGLLLAIGALAHTGRRLLDATRPGSLAHRSQRTLHRLGMVLLGGALLVNVALAALVLLPVSLPPLLASAVAVMPRLTGLLSSAPALVAVIMVELGFEQMLWSWSMQHVAMPDLTHTRPASRLLAQLRAVAESLQLTESRTEEGWSMAGTVEGLRVRLDLLEERLPTQLNVEIRIPSLPPDFRVVPRDRDPDAPRINDVILDQLLAVRGSLPPDLHQQLLPLVPGQPGGEIIGGTLRFRPDIDAALTDEHTLRDAIADGIALAHALTTSPAPAPQTVRQRRKERQ